MIVKLIDAAKSLVSFMSWERLAIVFLTGIVALFFTGAWENRNYAYSVMRSTKFQDGVLISITEPSRDSIKKYVTKDPNIVVIQVIGTDFVKLTRNTVFFFSKSQELQRDFDNWYETKTIALPIMVMNDDEQNKRVIAILNQQFVCTPLTPSMVKYIASAPKYAKQVCSISVPPRQGEMVGYLNFWMREPIEADDQPYYHELARQLANEIYNRDIISRQH